MNFCILNDDEFMNFVNTRPEKNFFQTTMMKDKLMNDGREVYLVGLKDNNKIVAASLIASRDSFLGYKTFEAYKGFILDYNNNELLRTFTKEITKFLKTKRAFRLFIDPNIQNVTRDADANIIEGLVDNRQIKKELQKIGYKELEIGEQPTWCYCLDINGKTSDTLLNEMKANTRNCINRTISKYKLEVKTLEYSELSDFKQITTDTCDRKNFNDKPLKYYQNMYNFFGKDVVYKICYLDCNKYIESLEEEIEELKEKKIKLSDSPSNDKKKATMQLDIDNLNTRLNEGMLLKKDKGNIIWLSCGMFMLYGDEIIYLFSGSYSEYMNFYGQYRIQWEMIKYAADHNYKRYNFYGIKDVFNKDSKDYGIYEFKKHFGGYVEELLGPFELTINPINHLFKISKNVKHLIPHKGKV